MLDMSQKYLPDELVNAIIIRMEEQDDDYLPIKRGLTSGSLTCRHWASLIRPMLFTYLTIRSAEDIAQLLAFVDRPDNLDPTLEDCIVWLNIIEDRESSNIPWSHQMSRLGQRLPALQSVTSTIENSGADDELHPGHSSPRPLAIIPRTLPGLIMPLSRLVLSHLRLPSVKVLASYVKHLCTRTIWLDAVTFVKEDVPDIRR